MNDGANAYVNLRGITVQGIGFGGGTGIRLDNSFALTLTNCVIRNYTGNGIDYRPNFGGALTVSNTRVGDNSGSGIYVQPFGASGPHEPLGVPGGTAPASWTCKKAGKRYSDGKAPPCSQCVF